MESLFQPQYWLFWGMALAVLLFFPIRKIIWVMSVRRAGVTAALLSFVFSIFYTNYLFGVGS